MRKHGLLTIGLASLADLTDLDIPMENLDPTLFPGVDDTVQVHSGFANEHAQSASIILNEVRSLISRYGATSVTLVSKIQYFM